MIFGFDPEDWEELGIYASPGKKWNSFHQLMGDMFEKLLPYLNNENHIYQADWNENEERYVISYITSFKNTIIKEENNEQGITINDR